MTHDDQAQAKRSTRAPRALAGSRWRRLWPAALLVAVLALIGAGAVLRNRDQADDAAGADDPGVVHVHGLGVNPKDGVLFAATHMGLFRIPEQGSAERVADRYQDTMGFTVIGPNRFLASGHPDLREMREKQVPPLLGLIESSDAGRTWRPRSLSGKADLHVLRAVQGRIYAYDSTGETLMVTKDSVNWETRGKVLLEDFAVSPADPDLIVATSKSGVQRSRDGGRTWEPVSAPPLALLAWQRPDDLWGAALDGGVYRSSDGGAGWQQRGALAGSPAALTANDTRLYAAVHEDGIYVSDDGGATWQPRYRQPGAGPAGAQR